MHATPKNLLVVYHSLTGGTEQMVHAFAEGAAEESGVRVDCRHAHHTDAKALLQADGFVFASPENLASMSGVLKDFFDRSYYAGLGHLQGRPYGIMICAGNDGDGAARQIERIATGWRLNLIQPALIIHTQAQTPAQILAPKQLNEDQRNRCREFGTLYAAGLAMAVF